VNDHVLPISHTERIAEALPRARLLVLAHAGHLAMLERHDEVDEAIEELLGQVSSDRRLAS